LAAAVIVMVVLVATITLAAAMVAVLVLMGDMVAVLILVVAVAAGIIMAVAAEAVTLAAFTMMMVSRRPKLNFPSYDGESDPLTWLNKCKTYFRGMRTMEVWIASLHLEGVAAEWYYALERDYGIISWVRFADFMHMRFGLPLQTNGLVELKDLHRTGSVEEYQQQFSLLLCRCDDLTPMQQVNLFTVGLGEPLRTDVELLAPSNL
jgi:hypothetical protein